MKKILILGLAILLGSCTEVMVMIPEFTPPETDRVILIEELTGANCPNCPSGAAALASLIELYDGKVIGVSIHGEFLANPLSNSKFDFRSEMADNLENYLKPWFGKPAAVINRVQQDGQPEFAISNVELWSQFVEKEFEKPQTVDIQLSTEYDPTSRTLKINTGILPLENIDGDIRISVMLTESHIIDAQKDQAVILDDYEHNHALRAMLTAFDGDGLSNGLSANDLINRSYNFIIPPEEGWWVAENMEVVVSIAKVTPTSKEVLQAAQTHVVE